MSGVNGVLLIDKPSGPTSHDVVQRMRRTLRERSIGHTGTLDPMATGLLPLVVGRATRLASLISGADKTYDATVRLGFGTDTDDAMGTRLVRDWGPIPERGGIAAALETFRGTYGQVPPQHSAKRVGGEKAYDLARQAKPVDLKPVPVTVHELAWLSFDSPDLRIRVRAAAGFYVRSLARDLGLLLGCGAHLTTLRRLASGSFTVDRAIPLEEAERLGPGLAERLVAPAEALPGLASVVLTDEGLKRALHGNPLGPRHLASRETGYPAVLESPTGDNPLPVKLLGPDGHLVALARREAGALHPVVVLG
jgi:tRNA pseudouridine55 synthase